ncbi:hypothetical protein ACQJBY_041190 [Aegilops geniculata]
MSAKDNHKQQQQRAVAQMVVAAMATPCPTKPLLVAIPLALGFALGIVATLSLMGSTASSALPGAALELFFPSPPVNVSTEVRRRQPPRPVQVQPQAAPATSASSPPPVPEADAGVNRHAALPVQRRHAAPATGVSSPPSPPVSDAGSAKHAAMPVNVRTADEGGERPAVDDDDRLMALAAAAPRAVRVGAEGAPKVAFLFLAKWDLPMAPLWERFFEGHRGLYSVYVHTDPAFNASAAAPDDGSAFHRRHIPSKEVKWGHISMVEAERRLLAHALLDHSNARFILLSESHVPLFDFPTVYSYLINSTKVYMESYDEPGGTGRGRYKRGMAPAITPWQWRKGSQWFELDRALAIDVIADDLYFPVFKKFCKHNCYADEHYLPTFLHIRHPEAAAGRTVTWVDWSHGGPHPSRFTRMEVTVDFLRWLRGGTKCDYNGRTTTVCFLFARKFLPNSLTRFLRFAPKVMGFG